MRLHVIALLVVSVSGCSSSEVTTTITGSSGSAPSSTASALKSIAAAPASASALASSSRAAANLPMRDADAELKAIDPLNETATDGAQRLLNAMTLCGEPATISPWGKQSDAPWGKDVPEEKPIPTKPGAVSRCAAESHAKLYMKSASTLADSSSPESKQMAELHAYYALALDPKVALPAGSNAAAKALLDATKSRKNALKWVVPGVRVGAVTTTDESATKDLEQAAAALEPTVRLCYASGLRNNPNLQGNLGVQAFVEADGRLSDVKVSGSLPDGGVLACVTEFATRSKLVAPSKTPTKVTIPFVFTPGGK